ncbi:MULTISPECIES: beta-1,6-N-acetylglucosaminyltransferase [Tenacibaculum]|uniref:beta-1,6-N-acetylglucosaminyltransferase n=1 Tax=Tenacibaculum TaxID=104267 RepID=UPI001F0A6D73|nr:MULTISPECIES: beta-1,6-N-acetylglucosaminyltransferase [Tenacibaculum]MCH3883286.1 beta-1,6-N-acetylglucosaminyltransferase [Tenacibaculum aquimarinum]MCH3884790.1 beta-1,6-N-acetylglucosaminyltransferase [Tenacibaculum aquimarinum]MDO6600358.1 beta-1,6-N-acetylglucosaminyltransferase [Tenacibaculum sp. 1_MG-2023]
MDITYIIQAHKHPLQLKRLITVLNTKNASFYVHIDVKSNIEDFKKTISLENVFFIKERVDCIWGDFSQVKATLNLIKNVIRDNRSGFVVFLSGQDYPIKNVNTIESFLLENKKGNFISLKPINELWSKKECDSRVKSYRFNYSSKRGDCVIVSKLNKYSVKCLLKGKITFRQFLRLIFYKKELKNTVNFHGGSNWWALNTETIAKVNTYISKNKEDLFSFFKYTHCSDEIFFQTIINTLMKTDNSINVEDSVTYVNWFRKKCTLPVTFNKDDLSELINQPSSKLFARKFDIDFDEEILDLLDKEISIK